MIEISAVFWIFVVLFGIIGLMRGWVREVQVTAAAVLGMFMIEQISPFVWSVLVDRTSAELLQTDPLGTLRRLVMLKIALMLIVVFFGYQGPVLIEFGSGGRVKSNKPRETIQEGLLGLASGLLNGYIIVGALWWYMHVSQYPFDWIVDPLTINPESASASLISFLPLAYLASPWLEILVVIFFLLVIIVII